MGGLGLAAILGVGLAAWRQVHRSHMPPSPGSLLAVLLLFGALSAIADTAPGSRRLVTLFAWGLDLAGLLEAMAAEGLWQQVNESISSAALAQYTGGGATGTGQAGGTTAGSRGSSVTPA